MSRDNSKGSLLRARAYAKINWLLDVGGLRPDGFHDLATIFQTIDLHDELTFTLAQELSLQLTGSGELTGELTADESNLVLRAARALQKSLPDGQTVGAAITLEKRIPLGGGLGGGSADAAITLLALNRLWQANLSQAQLVELAAGLGSDVPFFLTGGTAWGYGRGTEIEPLEDVQAPNILLVNPRVTVPTAAVYRGLDRLTNDSSNHILKTCSFNTSEMLFTQVRNTLSAVAIGLFPVIASVQSRLTELGGNPVLMSGSGATVWACFATREQMDEAANVLAIDDASRNWLVIKTRALSQAEYWNSLIELVD